VVFAIKYFFIGLKSKRPRAYAAGKYVVGAAAVYLVFIRPLIA
jgi:hypothetical protein